MAESDIDPGMRDRFDQLVRDELIPTQSSEKPAGALPEGAPLTLYSDPHAVYQVSLLEASQSGLWTARRQVGWQTLVFDGESPVSTPEIPNQSFDLASSGNEESAKALAHALEVAHEAGGYADAEYAVVRVPRFLAAVVLPAYGVAVAMDIPEPPESVCPFRPYALGELSALVGNAAREELERASKEDQPPTEWLPPNTRIK